MRVHPEATESDADRSLPAARRAILSTTRMLLGRDRRVWLSHGGLPFFAGTRRSWLASAIAVVALMGMPGVAAASDTTINFDNLASGTTISNQYAPQGVTFDQAPSGPATLVPFIQSDPAGAHSSPNVLNINQGGCGSEVTRHELWGRFAVPRNHVNLFVGDLNTAAAEPVTLSGYDLGGIAIPAASQTVTLAGGSGVHTAMSITDPNSQISFFNVLGSASARCLAIDDFSFDALPSTIAPDFGLSTLATSGTVVAGSSTSVPLLLHRTSTSTGAISLVVSGLPPSVSASFSGAGVSGNQTSGGDGSQITMTLTAQPNAPPTTNVPVTVTGTPSPGSMAGSQPRSVTIPISVSGNFDLRAQGIEVTQGITNTGVLQPMVSGGNYQGMFAAAPEAPVTASDPLVAHNRTVVRFYADAHGAPAGGVPGVGAVLHGFRNGVELSGSPIFPDYGPANLPDTGEGDPPPVFQSERTSDANAFTFTLPDSWTEGSIQLVADVVPPFPSFTGPQYVECSAPACQANNSFTLNKVSFITLPWVVIAPLRLARPGDPKLPSSPIPLYKRALLTEPGANQFAVLPYVGTVDPTPEVKADDDANSKLPSPTPCQSGYVCNQSHYKDYLKAVTNWGTNNLGANSMLSQPALPADILVGIQGFLRGTQSWSIYNEPLSNPAGQAAQAVNSVNFNRPLTSVAHELGHALGRNHADGPNSGCGDNQGPWPPDGRGYIQGIGLDTSTSPYRIIAPGLPGGPSQWYDKMSYCANTDESTANGNLPDAWISPFGWLHSIDALTLFGQRTGRGPNLGGAYSGYQGIESSVRGGAAGQLRARRARSPASRLIVTGTISPQGAGQIDAVTPTIQPAPPRAAGSGVQLVARDASGRMVATVAMATSASHGDPGPLFLEVEGSVPAKSVDSVQILFDGTVVATRTRSHHIPHVRILAPRAGAVEGHRRDVVVRWRASGATGHQLEIAIDYSADNGRHWRGIYEGPNRGSVTLPSLYFSGSRHARVRIRANDGFNQTVATSKPFIAVGAPPSVTILDPSRGQSFRGDVAVYLHGQAFNDALTPLWGRSLRWLLDGALIGRGVTTAARGLPGADRITLVARDASGRTASASTVVHVRPVELPFLRLSLPKRVSRRARQLRLRAASALPSTLIVGHKRYSISRTTRTITVRIVRGRQPLVIELSVTARGLTQPITVVVRRR